jgi:hypothetical protein
MSPAAATAESNGTATNVACRGGTITNAASTTAAMAATPTVIGRHPSDDALRIGRSTRRNDSAAAATVRPTRSAASGTPSSEVRSAVSTAKIGQWYR